MSVLGILISYLIILVVAMILDSVTTWRFVKNFRSTHPSRA